MSSRTFPTVGGPEAAGFHTTTRESKRAHLRVPAFKNATKIHRKDQQEREKRMKTVAGEGKKGEFLGVQRIGVQRRVQGFGVQGKGFCGQKQKQNKKKMKSKMRKKKKKKMEKAEKEETEQTPSVRLRPISTSANFDFGQLTEVKMAEVELTEVEHPLLFTSLFTLFVRGCHFFLVTESFFLGVQRSAKVFFFFGYKKLFFDTEHFFWVDIVSSVGIRLWDLATEWCPSPKSSTPWPTPSLSNLALNSSFPLGQCSAEKLAEGPKVGVLGSGNRENKRKK